MHYWVLSRRCDFMTIDCRNPRALLFHDFILLLSQFFSFLFCFYIPCVFLLLFPSSFSAFIFLFSTCFFFVSVAVFVHLLLLSSSPMCCRPPDCKGSLSSPTVASARRKFSSVIFYCFQLSTITITILNFNLSVTHKFQFFSSFCSATNSTNTFFFSVLFSLVWQSSITNSFWVSSHYTCCRYVEKCVCKEPRPLWHKDFDGSEPAVMIHQRPSQGPSVTDQPPLQGPPVTQPGPYLPPSPSSFHVFIYYSTPWTTWCPPCQTEDV